MNIQGINAAYGKTFEPKRPEQKSVPAHNSDLKTEKVEISEQSSEIQKLMSIVEEIADVRLDIVKEIKARIKTNDYPLENNLDEALKKMIQENLINPY